jgi:maltose/moltooligosaccharide transporter
MEKPYLSFRQLFNMSFGFLGIQFGWGLQLANMSAVYERLGARPDEVPLLWLAAPVTGLLVQPIVGALSDRTWGPLGRRRPYFLTGRILASVALFFMPTSGSLWMAPGCSGCSTRRSTSRWSRSAPSSPTSSTWRSARRASSCSR